MIQSPLLIRHKKLLHAFGTRSENFPAALRTAKQVHGTNSWFVTEEGASPPEGADILMTNFSNLPIGIQTADCLPILLYDSQNLIAAVHAGWRGTQKRVVQQAIGEMIRRGGKPGGIFAVIGPGISGRCYEVQGDVASQFSNGLTPLPSGRWLLDLALINRQQMLSAGVPPEQIDQIELCTHCRGDLFPSYRREGEKAGRMMSFIQLF